MKIKFLFLLLVFSCGNAYALPQDWPCFGLQVEKYDVINNNDGIFEYAYRGETQGYNLNINLQGFSEFPTSFANCGNSGCWGTISEKATGRTESLRFFCEEYSEDYAKVTCHVGFGEEAVFRAMGDGNYILNYCSDDQHKTLRFNLKDCDKCYCKMYWYNGEVRNTAGGYGMACKREENKAHCFTYYGYETWCDFKNKDDDFQNCVNLGF